MVSRQWTVVQFVVSRQWTVVQFVVSRQWTVVQFVVSRQWTAVQFVVSRQLTVVQFVVSRQWTVVQFVVSKQRTLWAIRFREGRLTLNDDPRPGRPKTSTDERSVKLVEDVLVHDRRGMCEEISQNHQEFTNISIPYFDK